MENKFIKTTSNDFFGMNHEKILFCQDKKSGLKAIIAVHNTVCGPALGGTRMWNYVNDQAALTDVMRLSRGSGLKGLSAMKSLSKIDNKISLFRPLLFWT